MKRPYPALAPLFRTDSQGKLLALLFLDPERERTVRELARAAEVSEPTALREVDRVEEAGLASSRKAGSARLVRLDSSHPLARPLAELVLATYGPPAVIAEEFEHVPGAEAIFLFGSWAARYMGEAGALPNDIDVLVVGQPDRSQLFDAAERAERRIGLPVQTTIRSTREWADLDDQFVSTVRRRALVPVLLEDDAEQ